MPNLSDLGRQQREELVDDISETMSDTCDMDVSFSQYAEAVVKMLEKRGLLQTPWQPISTAPKDTLIDILIDGKTRWCDCYYDQICDQWRTSSPGGKLIWVAATAVTHWRMAPTIPKVTAP